MSTARINRRLIPAIRAAAGNDLVGVASRELGKAAAFAAEWGIPRIFGSYEEMLGSDLLDAVYIALPNSLHAYWAVRAAEAGKHVLCEKPLAVSLDECDQIMAVAEASGVVVAEGVMYLYHPLLKRLLDAVGSGVLGEVQVVKGAFSFTLDRPDDVRWQPGLGGGSLWDVGSYPVSFIRRILGEPEAVFGWQQLSASEVDEGFAGLLRYASGALGVFDCGFRHPFRVEAEVIGSRGTLRLERPYTMTAESRIVIEREDAQEVVALPSDDPYRCEVEAVAAAVSRGAALPVSLSSSRANVATLLALYQSARQNAPRPVI